MGKKIHYLPLEWFSKEIPTPTQSAHRTTVSEVEGPDCVSLPDVFNTTIKTASTETGSSPTTQRSNEDTNNFPAHLATEIKKLQSQMGPASSIDTAPSYDEVRTIEISWEDIGEIAQSGNVKAIPRTVSSIPSPGSVRSVGVASQLSPVACSTDGESAAGLKTPSIITSSGISGREPTEPSVSPEHETNESIHVPQPSAQLHLGPLPTGPSLWTPSGLRAAALPGLTSRCRIARTFSPRNPVQVCPVPGQVYFLGDGIHFPYSIIHCQKRQNGFFRHPALIVGVEGDIVDFYALTKEPPRSIRELNMALRLGASPAEVGSNVLQLAPSSDNMIQQTWVNLEQRFHIEWKNLDTWAVRVQVDPKELSKIDARIVELEADQNRYIYKPLLRAMSTMQPGMVIMLPNMPGSSTFGAPVLIIENNYPNFRFLRIKRFVDNRFFNPASTRPLCSTRHQSLEISKFPKPGHDGTPVLVLDPTSPEMREASYVEVLLPIKTGNIDQCRTWCWPPVQLSMASMGVLDSYINIQTVRTTGPYYPPMPNHMMHYHAVPTHPSHTMTYNRYNQSYAVYHQSTHWPTYNAMQHPRYYMPHPQTMSSYPTYNFTPAFDAEYQPAPGAGRQHNV